MGVIQQKTKALGTELVQSAYNVEPNVHLRKLEASRQNKAEREKDRRREKGFQGRKNYSQRARAGNGYGVTSNQCIDLLTDEAHKRRLEQIVDKILNDQEHASDMEAKTRGQSNCDLWRSSRVNYVTASKFGRISRVIRPLSYKNILKECSIGASSPSLQHGLRYEKKGLEFFARESGLSVSQIGIVLHKQLYFIAATPDGYIESTDEYIEIKCPFYNTKTAKELPLNINDAINRKIGNIHSYLYRDENGCLQLNKKHEYFHQVQGQLNVGEKEFGYFVVYLFIPAGQPDKVVEDIIYIKIQRDLLFWTEKMLPHLFDFYFGYQLPNLVNNRNSANFLNYTAGWTLCDITRRLFKFEAAAESCLATKIKWSNQQLNYVPRARGQTTSEDHAEVAESDEG